MRNKPDFFLRTECLAEFPNASMAARIQGLEAFRDYLREDLIYTSKAANHEPHRSEEFAEYMAENRRELMIVNRQLEECRYQVKARN
jgi:hypothetical protein